MSRPAPTSNTNDNATSATTSALRNFPRAEPLLPDCSLSVVLTSTPRDCQAGAKPNSTPVPTAAASANNITRQSTLITATLGNKSGGTEAISKSVPQIASKIP